jgi:thiamine pyrophosphate-dependent acetolactate synthase large subunit-like protein
MGDICQLVYTGSFAFDVPKPRLWHYPAGYCTLGCGLPDAIGAKLALPDTPVVTFAGDGGFMFTVQELVTAAELGLPLPIILWNNESPGSIRILSPWQNPVVAMHSELTARKALPMPLQRRSRPTVRR